MANRQIELALFSFAYRYSNAAIAEPVGQIFFARLAVIGSRISGAKQGLVEDRFASLNQGGARPLLERTLRGRLKFFRPRLCKVSSADFALRFVRQRGRTGRFHRGEVFQNLVGVLGALRDRVGIPGV